MVNTASLGLPQQRGPYGLLASGIREKRIGPALIKGYTVGVYVHNGDGRRLVEMSNTDGNSGVILRELCADSSIPKHIHLTMLRDIPRDRISSSFKAALEARVPTPADKKFIEPLVNLFTAQKLVKATVVDVYTDKGGLSVKINGNDIGRIDSHVMAVCILQVYLDEHSVSPSCQSDAAAKVRSFLAHGGNALAAGHADPDLRHPSHASRNLSVEGRSSNDSTAPSTAYSRSPSSESVGTPSRKFSVFRRRNSSLSKSFSSDWDYPASLGRDDTGYPSPKAGSPGYSNSPVIEARPSSAFALGRRMSGLVLGPLLSRRGSNVSVNSKAATGSA